MPLQVSRIGALQPQKVALFRALKLGDLLVAVPALRAIRAAMPSAKITFVGLPWAREFAARFDHLIDAFQEFPGWPGLPERRPKIDCIPAFLAAVQAEQFDLAIQMHGSGSFVNIVCTLFGAKHTAGFYASDQDCLDPEWFMRWPDRGLELRRLLALTEFLGCPSQGEHLEFPLCSADFKVADQIRRGIADYVCIHAGASVPERLWPLERFTSIAATFAHWGLNVMLTGCAGERERTGEIADVVGAPAISVAGQTDLGAIGALIAGARLLVCNDTGVSHIAAALRTPSIVISTGTNPDRWAPTDSALHRVLCRPEGWPDVADVIAHAEELLTTFVHDDRSYSGCVKVGAAEASSPRREVQAGSV